MASRPLIGCAPTSAPSSPLLLDSTTAASRNRQPPLPPLLAVASVSRRPSIRNNPPRSPLSYLHTPRPTSAAPLQENRIRTRTYLNETTSICRRAFPSLPPPPSCSPRCRCTQLPQPPCWTTARSCRPLLPSSLAHAGTRRTRPPSWRPQDATAHNRKLHLPPRAPHAGARCPHCFRPTPLPQVNAEESS